MTDGKANNSPGKRYNGLDAVRSSALIIGIVFHGVESFVSYIPPMVWAIKDEQNPVFIDGFFFVAHVFRMQAFFLVAGFFARMVSLKLGTSGFLMHRIRRIALPLILFWPLVYFPIVVLWVWGIRLQILRENPSSQLINIIKTSINSIMSGEWLSSGFPLTHLWFLYALLWIYLLFLALHTLLAQWLDVSGTLRSKASIFFTNVIHKPFGSLIFALPTIPMMLMMKNGFGVDTPDHGLIPYLPSLGLYCYYFMLGWMLHRDAKLLEMFRRYRIVNSILGLALISIVAIIFLSGVYHHTLGSSFVWLTNSYNALYAFASMTSMFGFIGMMLFYFSEENNTIRFLADASYWMYVIHLPVVVFFQILLAPVHIHWMFKVFLILIPSFGILLLSYQYFVRFTWVGKLLNGKNKATLT